MRDLFGDLSRLAIGLAQPPPVVVPALPPLFASIESELQTDGAPPAEDEFREVEFALEKASPEAQSFIGQPPGAVPGIQASNTAWKSASPAVSRMNYGPENKDSGDVSEGQKAGLSGTIVGRQNKEAQVQSILSWPARTVSPLGAEEAKELPEGAQNPRNLPAPVKDIASRQEKPPQTTPDDPIRPARKQSDPAAPDETNSETLPPGRLWSGPRASPIQSIEGAGQLENQPPAPAQKRPASAQRNPVEAGKPEGQRMEELIQPAAFQPATLSSKPIEAAVEPPETPIDSHPTSAQKQRSGRVHWDEGGALLNPVELLRSSPASPTGLPGGSMRAAQANISLIAPDGSRRAEEISVPIEAPANDSRGSLVIPARGQTRTQANAPQAASSSEEAVPPAAGKEIGPAPDTAAVADFAPANRIEPEAAPAGSPDKSSFPAYSPKLSRFTMVQPASTEAREKKWLQPIPAAKPDKPAEDHAPIIRVSIGRVVVRGSVPQAQPQSQPQAAATLPPLSLEDYLKTNRRRER